MSDRHDELLKQLGAHARERQAQEATAPLGDAFHSAMAQQIEAQLTAEGAGTRSAPWRRWGAGIGLAASVLAALVLVLSRSSLDQIPELPAYVADMRGGASVRSAAQVAAFDVGDRFELVLRPATAVEGPLRLVAFERSGDGLTPVAFPPPQWSADGAARLRAMISGEPPFVPGQHDFVLVVAHEGYVPHRSEVLAAVNGDARALPFRALTVRVAVAIP